jgi:DnaD/phage-associated family protein
MNSLKIKSCFPREVTIVPNEFLDRYMPRANGEFVKIYLYLLRAPARGEGLTLCAIADRMNCTEKDVLRALRYWAGEKILELETDASGENLTGITFLDFKAPEPDPKPDGQLSLFPSNEEDDGKVSMDRAAELKANEDIKELLFITEKYLEKNLTKGEMQRLLYFYDGLHFSTDLIDFLIEYCVSNGHKSFRYIEKVAYNWHEEGITTVREARASVNNYHRDYYDILKAFGITSRSPIEGEIVFMRKWIENYGFPMDVIHEACTRTVLKSGKASFSYADGILTRWFKAGVRNASDIRVLDEAHELKAQTPAGGKGTNTGNERTVRPNAFNDFEQRSYDFDSLESRLLKGEN